MIKLPDSGVGRLRCGQMILRVTIRTGRSHCFAPVGEDVQIEYIGVMKGAK